MPASSIVVPPLAGVPTETNVSGPNPIGGMSLSNTSIATFGGWVVGRAYDATLLPFALGFTILSSLALLLIVLVEGPGGMFGRREIRR